MYMKRTPTLADKGSRKREPHKLMLKTWRTWETRLIVQQCTEQHILLNYVCMQATKRWTKLLNSCQRDQGYQKTWSAQRIQTIVKKTHLVHSCRTRPWIVHTIRDKNFDILGQVRMLKRRSCRTQKGENNIHIDNMSRPCRHIIQHGSFHILRCAVTAGVLKTLPLYAMRADSPERHVPSVLASGLR